MSGLMSDLFSFPFFDIACLTLELDKHNILMTRNFTNVMEKKNKLTRPLNSAPALFGFYFCFYFRSKVKFLKYAHA